MATEHDLPVHWIRHLDMDADKSEIRISKSETNSNDEKSKFETIRFGRSDIEVCKGCSSICQENEYFWIYIAKMSINFD